MTYRKLKVKKHIARWLRRMADRLDPMPRTVGSYAPIATTNTTYTLTWQPPPPK